MPGGIVPVPTQKPENQGSQWCKSQSKSESPRPGSEGVNSHPSLKAQEPRVPMSKSRRRWISQFKQENKFNFCHLFVLSALKRLDDACPLVSATFTPQIQTLISSGNTLTDTPRSNVFPAIWASLQPVKLTHVASHHSGTARIQPRSHSYRKSLSENCFLLEFVFGCFSLPWSPQPSPGTPPPPPHPPPPPILFMKDRLTFLSSLRCASHTYYSKCAKAFILKMTNKRYSDYQSISTLLRRVEGVCA